MLSSPSSRVSNRKSQKNLTSPTFHSAEVDGPVSARENLNFSPWNNWDSIWSSNDVATQRARFSHEFSILDGPTVGSRDGARLDDWFEHMKFAHSAGLNIEQSKRFHSLIHQLFEYLSRDSSRESAFQLIKVSLLDSAEILRPGTTRKNLLKPIEWTKQSEIIATEEKIPPIEAEENNSRPSSAPKQNKKFSAQSPTAAETKKISTPAPSQYFSFAMIERLMEYLTENFLAHWRLLCSVYSNNFHQLEDSIESRVELEFPAPELAPLAQALDCELESKFQADAEATRAEGWINAAGELTEQQAVELQTRPGSAIRPMSGQNSNEIKNFDSSSSLDGFDLDLDVESLGLDGGEVSDIIIKQITRARDQMVAALKENETKFEAKLKLLESTGGMKGKKFSPTPTPIPANSNPTSARK